MNFGEVDVHAAQGAVLAHSVKLPDGTLKKGCVIGAQEIARLTAAGIARVVAAQPEPGDVAEDVAAARIAAALAGSDVRIGRATTGRANLYAQRDGLLRLDVSRLHAANAIDESLTIATLLPDTPVRAGQMLATVKIIPYAVAAAALDTMLAVLQPDAALRVAPWRGTRTALVMTRLPDTGEAVLAKMRAAVSGRLTALGGQLVAEEVVAHEEAALSATLARLLAMPQCPELLLVSGIAATVDRGDVVPAAVVRAGGRVVHAGMPVDPGNLLLLAEMPHAHGACPLVGIPTCARSPKLNGFDFVLRRLAAGEPVTRADIMAMGVGGLLTEIESRPLPRDAGQAG